MTEKEFVGRGFAVGLGVLCAILIAALVYSVFAYNVMLQEKGRQISSLGFQPIPLQEPVIPLQNQIAFLNNRLYAMQNILEAMTQPPEWQSVTANPNENRTVTFGETNYLFFYYSDQHSIGVGLRVGTRSDWVAIGTTGFNKCLGVYVFVLEISNDYVTLKVREQRY